MRVALTYLVACTALAATPPLRAQAQSVATPRGATVMVQTDVPAGAGPFPTVVLASGAGYHMDMPTLRTTAQALAAQGVAVYRFNWAYFSAEPRGQPSAGLRDEVQDLQTVLALARRDARVDTAAMWVAGKSLGSGVAWQVLRADPALRGAALLTPVCTENGKPVADGNYPGLGLETRSLLLVLGDADPLCKPAMLYQWAAAAPHARVVVVGGDHGFASQALAAPLAEAALTRRLKAVADAVVGWVRDEWLAPDNGLKQ